MKKMMTAVMALMLAFALTLPVMAKKKVEKADPDMAYPQVSDGRFVKDVDKKAFKCKKRVAYKEVLPGVSEALTREPAIQTAIGYEKYDIAAGKARVIDKQVHCDGFGLVICTAIVTICYNYDKAEKKAK